MVLAAHFSETGYRIASGTKTQLSVLLELARINPACKIILFLNSRLNASVNLPENVEIKIISPAIKNRLLLIYWYQFRLPNLLKKEKATAFLSFQPVAAAIKEIPQYIWLTDISLFSGEALKTQVGKRAIESLHEASGILVPGKLTSGYFEQQFRLQHKVNILPPPVEENPRFAKMQPVPDVEYLVIPFCSADMSRLRTMLKAFTLFKKRQRSGMHLLLIVQSGLEEKAATLLSTYKLNNFVNLVAITKWSEARRVFSSAYMIVYMPQLPVADELTAQLILAEKALVCTDEPFWRDIFSEAAVYAGFNEEGISIQMMNLYKNESQKLAREELLSAVLAERMLTESARKLNSLLTSTPL